MLKRNKFVFAGVAAAMLAAGPWVGSAVAVIDPPSSSILARGETEAKRLLLIMEYMEEDEPLKTGSVVGMELQHHCSTSLRQDALVFSLLKK